MIDLELNEQILNQNSSESSNSLNVFIPNDPIRKDQNLRKFRVDCRNFFLTYPKSPAYLSKYDVMEYLINLCQTEYTYICVAKELHLDGSQHFHVLLMLNKKKNISNSRYFDINSHDMDLRSHCNIQSARNVDDVLTYITKTDKDCATDGVFVSSKTKKSLGEDANRLKRAELNQKLINQPIKESIESGLCSIFHYTKLKENILSYNVDNCIVPEYFLKSNLWIVGSTGIGKSRWVRTTYPGGVNDFFYKAQNKWWDGYNGQKVVLIDDFDRSGKCLGHHLKIWGDCYRFSAEIKGGTMIPNVERIIITSQYTPQDIWSSGPPEERDEQLVLAISRRFPIVTIDMNGFMVPYEEES